MPSAPPDAEVERFRADFAILTNVAPAQAGASAEIGTYSPKGPRRRGGDARIGLAVSGGPDSLALLLLAHAAGLDCEAATVDHCLRPEGATEAAFVARVCTELGVPHSILTLGPPDKGNLSDWARDARYGALADWVEERGLDWLATAHHADDQLETMIMRLNRGSGVGGLSGIRARRGQVIRPLLHWRKSDLEALVVGCGVTAVVDPTNQDDRFDRARLRKALTSADWLDPVAAASSADALAEAEEALAWTAKAYENRRLGESGGVLSFDPRDLPRELLRRILLAGLRRIVPGATPRGGELDRLISALTRGQTVTLSGVKCTGGTFWLFAPAPPRRTD